MKTEANNNKIQAKDVTQGFIANPQVYLNQETNTLVHKMGDEIKIEMPVNLYKKILGIPFEKKETRAEEQEKQPSSRKVTFGFIAKPAIYLSKDGKYLHHRVLGVRISKHANYYRKIFGAEYISEAKTTEAVSA